MAELRQTVFVAAVKQTVGVLYRCDSGQAACFGKLQILRHAPRGFVGNADMSYLAGLDEVLQHLEGFLDGYSVGVVLPGVGMAAERDRGAVGPVQLVKVQVVGLQAL